MQQGQTSSSGTAQSRSRMLGWRALFVAGLTLNDLTIDEELKVCSCRLSFESGRERDAAEQTGVC